MSSGSAVSLRVPVTVCSLLLQNSLNVTSTRLSTGKLYGGSVFGGSLPGRSFLMSMYALRS